MKSRASSTKGQKTKRRVKQTISLSARNILLRTLRAIESHIHVVNVEHGDYTRCALCRGESGQHLKHCLAARSLKALS